MIPRPCDLVVNKWGARYRGQSFPVAIGRSGIGVKRGEGDGITPAGIWQLAEVRYRADRAAPPITGIPAKAIGPQDKWSDDPKDPAYNTEISKLFHGFSHERLCRADPLYDRFAILDFNWPKPISGAGSAIFLHIWRKPRHPTEGCIAFAPEVFEWILSSWHPEARVFVKP